MIDIKTGNVKVSNDIIISRDQNYDDILALAPNSKTRDIQNGYQWIYFENIAYKDTLKKDVAIKDEFKHLLFFMGVCFYHGSLCSIDFGFRHKYQAKPTWENWSEADELKRKASYEKWLTMQFGEKRNYPWGTFGAYYDPRSARTAMYVQYHTSKSKMRFDEG